MKKIINKKTGCKYTFMEKKDYLKNRHKAEKFHIKVCDKTKRIAKEIKSLKLNKKELFLFLHYIFNQIGLSNSEEVNLYELSIKLLEKQQLINDIFYQVKYDFPNIGVPRSLEHLNKLRG